jgi:hypothetical protein
VKIENCSSQDMMFDSKPDISREKGFERGSPENSPRLRCESVSDPSEAGPAQRHYSYELKKKARKKSERKKKMIIIILINTSK